MEQGFFFVFWSGSLLFLESENAGTQKGLWQSVLLVIWSITSLMKEDFVSSLLWVHYGESKMVLVYLVHEELRDRMRLEHAVLKKLWWPEHISWGEFQMPLHTWGAIQWCAVVHVWDCGHFTFRQQELRHNKQYNTIKSFHARKSSSWFSMKPVVFSMTLFCTELLRFP